MKTTHAIVLIFESFEIQTLAGNTAMLFLRKVQKSRKAFLKRLSKTCKSRRKGTPFILTFKKSVSHFLKKVISRWRKGFLKKKFFYFFESSHVKEKKRNAFLPTHSLIRNSLFFVWILDLRVWDWSCDQNDKSFQQISSIHLHHLEISNG